MRKWLVRLIQEAILGLFVGGALDALFERLVLRAEGRRFRQMMDEFEAAESAADGKPNLARARVHAEVLGMMREGYALNYERQERIRDLVSEGKVKPLDARGARIMK